MRSSWCGKATVRNHSWLSLPGGRASAARRAAAEAAARDFDTALRATEARQRGGLASLFELEDARRSAAGARSQWVELQRERVAAWITLYRALGGGWSPASSPAESPTGSLTETAAGSAAATLATAPAATR